MPSRTLHSDELLALVSGGKIARRIAWSAQGQEELQEFRLVFLGQGGKLISCVLRFTAVQQNRLTQRQGAAVMKIWRGVRYSP
jgi:hypothetical protein